MSAAVSRLVKTSASKLSLYLTTSLFTLPVFATLTLSPALAQVVSWTGSQSSDWNTGGNWSTNTAPKTNASVTINNLTGHSTSADGVTFTGSTLNIGSVAGSSGSLELINNSDFTLNSANIGSSGTGSLYITDSKLTSKGTLAIGSQGNGSVIISGADASLSVLNAYSHLNIGNNANGNGTLEILNGATVNAWNVSLGNLNGSGTLKVDGNGSSLNITDRDLSAAGNTGDVSILVSNAGRINISGSDSWLQLGSKSGTVTSLMLTGAGSQINTTGYGLIAEFGTVNAWVENQAELKVGTSLILGASKDAKGQLVIDSQGQVSVTKDTVIGLNGGHGSLTLSGGGNLTSAGNIYMAQGATSTGVLNIGAATGEAAAAAGTLDAPAIAFGSGTGRLVFNHTGNLDESAFQLNSNLTGNGIIDHLAGFTHLTAVDNSAFTGSTTIYGGTMQVDGMLGGVMNVQEQGRLHGNGTVGTTINRGTIAPGNIAGQPGGTLIIDGDYTGENGRLEIETVLGDDTSVSDVMKVLGSTYGHTTIKVINIGGSGAQTANGIRIIDVGGTSDGTFALESDDLYEGEKVVFAGAYGYRLYQNGLDVTDDGNWYLRSALTDGTPLYQRGAAVYESYGSVLQNFNQLSTLQQRIGSRLWAGEQSGTNIEAPTGNLAQVNGFWGQIEGSHSKFDPKYSTTRAGYNVDIWKMRTGLDGLLHETDSGKLIGGLTAHYGHAGADITSVHGNGDISTTGYGLGGTLTWYDENGFYTDGQAQATWYKSDLSADFASPTSIINGNKGFGYALSIESGKRITLNESWSITPQAQLAYSHINFDSFTDQINANVALHSNDSLQSRFGLAVEHQNTWQDDMGKNHHALLYGIANINYEFLDGNELTIDSIRFASRNDRAWGGIGFGGSTHWNSDQYSLYGEGSINTSLSNFGDSYTYKGMVGLRAKW